MREEESKGSLPPGSRVLCVDIGGTSSKVGLLHWPEPVSPMQVVPTRGPASSFADQLCNAIEEVLQTVDSSAIVGIGVAVAGILDDGRTELLYNSNLPWLEGFPLKRFLMSRFSLPVELDTDANAATLGEGLLGAGQGVLRFMCVAVGTGIGVGMIVNSEPLRVAYGCLGDAGHIKVEPQGQMCPCGGRGCAEGLVSAPLMARRYQERLKLSDECTLRTVIEAARIGEPVAVQMLAEAGNWLGILTASLADTFFPELIGVAGGLAESGDLVMEHLQRSFHLHVSAFGRERVRVQRARLGARATLTGAGFSFGRFAD